MPYKPIRDYGIIGNQCTVALVGMDGSIDWCCFPRVDSPSVFAAILDDASGGRFSICPASRYVGRQEYLPETNVLVTTFTTRTGQVTLTDFMPLDEESRPGEAPHQIYRMVACVHGEVEMGWTFQPQFNYAGTPTSITRGSYGLVARGGDQSLALSTSLPLIPDESGKGTWTIREGEVHVFVLSYGESRTRKVSQFAPWDKRRRTEAYWRAVAGGLWYDGPWKARVVRSFLALHLLVYRASGAIVAAPTASLPEVIGGIRNWDYRYTWLRDASFTLGILYRLGHDDEARGFFRWLLRNVERNRDRTHILYGIADDSDLTERTLDHLEGYEGSRPVRVGNEASNHIQMDIFGSVIASIATYHKYGGYLGDAIWSLVEHFAEVVCRNWRRVDRSIWEVRGSPQHFVYSKVMCWVALDRAVSLGQATGRSAKTARWRRVADAIKKEVLREGWSERKQAFVQRYGSETLDAGNLIIPMSGFLSPQDPRVATSIRQTVEELGHGALLHRYDVHETDDGLAGEEGAFTMLSFWMIGSLLMSGQVRKAHDAFEQVLKYANHLGLFSEMIAPDSGAFLGNFPQAFSHVGLLHTARNLTLAEELGGPSVAVSLT